MHSHGASRRAATSGLTPILMPAINIPNAVRTQPKAGRQEEVEQEGMREQSREKKLREQQEEADGQTDKQRQRNSRQSSTV